MSAPDVHQVAGSWWASGAGWVLSMWAWFTGGAAPMVVAATVTALILTCIKIAQEWRAWKSGQEQTAALRALRKRLERRSAFDRLDTTP